MFYSDLRGEGDGSLVEREGFRGEVVRLREQVLRVLERSLTASEQVHRERHTAHVLCSANARQ